jgi:signal transduction histidine kinase
MNNESRTLTHEDWGFMILRGVFLIAGSLIYYLLFKDTGRTDITANMLIPLAVGILLTAGYLLVTYFPALRRALPFAILIGDLILAGIFAGLGYFDDPLLQISIPGGLMLTAAIRLNFVWTIVQSIGIVAVVIGELLATEGASQVSLLMPMLAPRFVALLLEAVLAIGWSYVHEKAGAEQQQAVERMNRRMRHMTENMQGRNRVIADMTATLSATLNPDRVLEAALEAGQWSVQPSIREKLISAALLFRDDGQLHVATSRGFTRSDMVNVVPGQNGLLGHALRECIPVFGKDARRDPELQFFAGLQHARSLLVIPLHANYDNFGVLVYGSEDTDAFNKEDTDMLMAIGTQTTIALHNAVLYHNLLEEKERIVEVEEDARRKLARDLHDGPTQNVSAIAMRMSYIYRLLERRPEEVPGELKKVEELARRTTKEIRDMLFTLRPLVLESQGLAAALDQLCQKTLETHGQQVASRVGPDVEAVLDSHQQGVIFYIVEEAVGNARKHAEAELISINIQRQNDVVVVEIADNGVGFDSDAVNANYDQRGSLGMVNMRERAALLDGTLRIQSSEGQGTKITVVVPIKPSMADNRNKRAKSSTSSTSIRPVTGASSKAPTK